jgi:hypothetical protein
MRIGVVLSPTGDWQAIRRAAQLADDRGLDAVGFYTPMRSMSTRRRRSSHSLEPSLGVRNGRSIYRCSSTGFRTRGRPICLPRSEGGRPKASSAS